MMKRKKRNKKKVDYFELNTGSIILLLGFVFLLINSLLLRKFFLIGYALIYIGLTTHLILVGDKPFLKSKNFIKLSRNFIYAIVLVFLFFAFFGFIVPPTPEIEETIMNFLKELLEQTKDFNQLEMTQFLFLNNLQSSFFGLLLGIVLGIFPILSSMVNGYVLGFVAAKTVESEGIFILWRLFPHGIFELPAIFISLGMGLKFGTFVFQKKKMNSFKNYFWNGLRVFLFVIIPLLIIAAIIEGALIFLFG